MKTKKKNGGMLDYAIGVLMITILLLATFLLPQLYSVIVDSKDLNRIHVVERESFYFANPVEMTVGEKVQKMMEALSGRGTLQRTLYLSGSEISGELLQRVREALGFAAKYKLIPDVSAYDLEHNVVTAEYYAISNGATENVENAFWNLRFTDSETFDLTIRIDAKEYVIYQMELYCAEALEYNTQLMSDDKEVVEFLNGQFMDGCNEYFEVEGYEAMTDVAYGEMILMLGYERGEYAVYRGPCTSSLLSSEGIRWGFVPMTVALERGNAIREWGYRGIETYFLDMYGVEVYEDSQTE
ncbi:MAG: hypothetical protein HDR11_08405 [Lachnospiraceae bacterium]|nr:hypothetical protein [Lachnospiraceae bacterium]MBD5512559.1 hypothetical protein [Lachnospiraceae bacterium]